jgi:hypothetical protein
MSEQTAQEQATPKGAASVLDDGLCASAVSTEPTLQAKTIRAPRYPKCLGWPRCGCILQGRKSDCA